jgi:hypothetical protein
MKRRLALPFALLLAIACGEEETPTPVRRAPPPPPTPIAAGRAIGDAAAFALVPTDEGALLVWGAPYARGGGVRALSLGPRGEALETDRRIALGGAVEEHVSPVVEIDAATAGRSVGIAWIVDHGRALETQSIFSPDSGHNFRPVEDLGPSVRIDRDLRGRLSMAADAQGSIVLYHRIPEAACVASEGTCARFTRAGVGTDPSRAMRGTEPLEVLRPCEPFVTGARFHGGTWYYAVCHREPEPTTTLFAIRPALSYAAPFDTRSGCVARGIAPLDEGVALTLECGTETIAYHIDEMGRERARFDTLERTITCEDGRPALQIGPRAVLRLAGSTDHVEALLPETIAPRGARAIWTGESLLVAAPIGHEVSLRRYECGPHGFDRTDVR